MRAVVQRVTSARVTVGDDVVGEIGPGLCVLVGVTHDDDELAARKLADKVWNVRVFDDDRGQMNDAVASVGGALLVVSQFTLYGDTRRGRRPSWSAAARPDHAALLVERFVDALRELGGRVETGQFGAHMVIGLVNDGPVTLILDV